MLHVASCFLRVEGGVWETVFDNPQQVALGAILGSSSLSFFAARCGRRGPFSLKGTLQTCLGPLPQGLFDHA